MHFFGAAALMFVLYSWLNNDVARDPSEIVVDAERVTALSEGFRRTWRRPPTRQELQSLVDSWVREEILYREGVAMRLDVDDPVVRRRVAQRVDFIADS